MFPHGEVVRSKCIFLISEKIYNFLTNSKPQTPSLAEGNSGALTTAADFGKGSTPGCDHKGKSERWQKITNKRTNAFLH